MPVCAIAPEPDTHQQPCQCFRWKKCWKKSCQCHQSAHHRSQCQCQPLDRSTKTKGDFAGTLITGAHTHICMLLLGVIMEPVAVYNTACMRRALIMPELQATVLPFHTSNRRGVVHQPRAYCPTYLQLWCCHQCCWCLSQCQIRTGDALHV
jgi:hypothetical protein